MVVKTEGKKAVICRKAKEAIANATGVVLKVSTRSKSNEERLGTGVYRHIHLWTAQDKARSEGARLLEEARAAIEQEKKAAIADIRQQVATLSVEIAEKVLRQNLKDDKAQMDLIDRMLDDVSKNQ